MTDEQKEYIEKNINLIESSEWNKFFEAAPDGIAEVLYEARVDFLTDLDYVPYGAFDHCYNILTITIPDNIYKIDPYAFNCCKNLQSVVLSNNLKSIDTRAFNRCKSLTDMDMPDGLIEINSYAFNNCVNLSKVHIPSSVINIEYQAFARCEHINIVYDGAKENWSKIIKNNSFDSTSYTCTCIDGVVKKSK